MNGVQSISSAPRTEPFIYPQKKAALDRIYHLACAILRTFVYIAQYSMMKFSSMVSHWRWLPSPISYDHVQVSVHNIANLVSLVGCVVSIFSPVPKGYLQEIGRKEDLRVTHDIVYRPASGLCLGISLEFLFLLFEDGIRSDKDRNLRAAKLLKGGGGPRSVHSQAIYDALLGIDGSISNEEIKQFKALMQRQVTSYQFIQHREIFSAVTSYMEINEKKQTLRGFVFEELEKNGRGITPNEYSLTLELDAFWDHIKGGKNTSINYQSIHRSVLQATMREMQLEIVEEFCIKDVSELHALSIGNYLVQFPNHTVVLVKTETGMALLDPSVGMAWLSEGQQKEALSQLVNYYVGHETCNLQVFKISFGVR